MDPQRGLGIAVRTLRQQAGQSQEDLASRAGLPITLVTRIEAGKSDPTWGDMRKVAAALDVSLEKLSELAEEFEAYGPEKPIE